ncbi:MAG: hypothetical protein IJQ81_16125 [Oscillibacter sp.]|nr:hypothetical protein [Oscillibacter sp.]
MILKDRYQIQLDVDSINYDRLDRFVSGKLSGPVKLWVHGYFFKKVRSLNSRSTERANREFVDGANWGPAPKEILKAVNQEARSFGISVESIRFEMNGSKVRITLKVSRIQNALNHALSDLGIRLASVTLQDAPW